MLRSLVAVVVAFTAQVATLAAPAAAADPPVTYVAPVDAPVVDPFRPPPTPFAAGNRGLEYSSSPGEPVLAAAAGEVVFAGPVAGNLHVTVLHADGIRTSYSFLAGVAVARGDTVEQGDVVGTAGSRLFFGARVGDDYVDPALLLGAGPPVVHLVPLDPAQVDPADERRALSLLGPGHRAAVGGVMAWVRGAGAAAVGAVHEHAGSAVVAWRAIGHEVAALDPVRHLRAVAEASGRWELAQATCTSPDRAPPPPPSRRIAVLVGGLGSTSVDAAIDGVDTAALGYDPGDVVRFSYAGGRTPDPTDAFTDIAATAYTSADSQADLRTSGAALARLLRQVAAAAPGVPVDVLAHSQGGIVARLALDELDAGAGQGDGHAPVDGDGRRGGDGSGDGDGRGDGSGDGDGRGEGRGDGDGEPADEASGVDGSGTGLPAVLVTIGSPHGGADLATAVAAARASPGGRAVLATLARVLALGLAADSPAVAGLAETAAVIADLAGHPLPAGVAGRSVAARGDLVVPAGRSRLPGAELVVVPVGGPTAHDRLPATPEVTREIALTVAGLAGTCESRADAIVDALTAETISWAEDAAGLVAATTGVALSGPLPP